jgi:cyclopropane-fatty-acyl-phospholipid synthase
MIKKLVDSPMKKPFRLHHRGARALVLKSLSGMNSGTLSVSDDLGQNTFGEDGGLSAAIQVSNPAFYRKALTGGTMAVAETYMRGDWDCDDLTSLFRLFIRNRRETNRLDNGTARLSGLWQKLSHWFRGNSRKGSRKNIAAHYDLGNEFYKLWLDDTMAYSSGVFSGRGCSMQSASIEKFDRICRKLEILPGDRVAEIGTGWGGFAIHAAGKYGGKITTTTISEEQFQEAKVRVQRAGLDGHVEILKQDYRDFSGQFDKLVSIEMIEAVGYQYLDTYFRKCGELLKPDGTFVLQAIVMPERGYQQYLNSVEFLQRYIFPGGCLPSLGAILESVGRTSDMRLVHVEDLAPHYAETLRRWRYAFHANLDRVRKMGYPEEFIRMWRYYLCYCEAAFEERHVGVLQVTFDKPECRRDPARLNQLASRVSVALPDPELFEAPTSLSIDSLSAAGCGN